MVLVKVYKIPFLDLRQCSNFEVLKVSKNAKFWVVETKKDLIDMTSNIPGSKAVVSSIFFCKKMPLFGTVHHMLWVSAKEPTLWCWHADELRRSAAKKGDSASMGMWASACEYRARSRKNECSGHADRTRALYIHSPRVTLMTQQCMALRSPDGASMSLF